MEKTLYDLRKENAERLEKIGYAYELMLGATSDYQKRSEDDIMNDDCIKFVMEQFDDESYLSSMAKEIAPKIISTLSFTESKLADLFLDSLVPDDYKNRIGYEQVKFLLTKFALNHPTKMEEYRIVSEQFKKNVHTVISSIRYYFDLLEKETGMSYDMIVDTFDTWFFVRSEIINYIAFYVHRNGKVG